MGGEVGWSGKCGKGVGREGGWWGSGYGRGCALLHCPLILQQESGFQFFKHMYRIRTMMTGSLQDKLKIKKSIFLNITMDTYCEHCSGNGLDHQNWLFEKTKKKECWFVVSVKLNNTYCPHLCNTDVYIPRQSCDWSRWLRFLEEKKGQCEIRDFVSCMNNPFPEKKEKEPWLN